MQKLGDYRAWVRRGPLWRFALIAAVMNLALGSLCWVVLDLLHPIPAPVAFVVIAWAIPMTTLQTWMRATRPDA